MVENSAYYPEDLNEALTYLSKGNCRPLAGGTDLMVSYSRGAGATVVFPFDVVFISHLKELRGISKDTEGNITIGACTTAADIAESDIIPYHVRLAASKMGAISLRNAATIGGNIGNASPKGDLPAPLVMYDTEVVLASLDGERRMPLEQFITGSKKTLLKEGELIRSFIIPAQDFDYDYVMYRKIGTRKANAISKLTFDAAARVDGDVITEIRICSSAAGPKTIRSRDYEKSLIGKKLFEIDDHLIGYLDEWDTLLSPHAMPEYRRTTTRRMLGYFLMKIISHDPQREL